MIWRRGASAEVADQPEKATREPSQSVAFRPTADPSPALESASATPARALTQAPAAPVEAKSKLDQASPRLERENVVFDPEPPDLRGLSPEELRQIGQKLHEAIKSGHPLADDRALLRRLESLARPLTAEKPPAAALQFHILDSDLVNAFSHIGGHIYVTRGVFDLAQTDAELEFVIAHELAHLERGHEQARLEQLVRQAGATAGRIAWLNFVLALGYTDDQEFEADAWAYQALRRLGRSRREAIGFLRRYSAYADEHFLTFGHATPKSRPGDPRQDIENHLPAHPPARLRLARLQASTSSAKKGPASAISPR